MGEYQLAREIVELSKSDKWDDAKQEWKLDYIYESDEPHTCLCGHYPIKEICHIVNSSTGKEADVGNCCVKKFLGISSDTLFNALKKVKQDIAASFNADTIYFCHQRGAINDWERGFYLDIWRKRSLSHKQEAKKQKINEKILTQTDRFWRGS